MTRRNKNTSRILTISFHSKLVVIYDRSNTLSGTEGDDDGSEVSFAFIIFKLCQVI